MDQGTVSGGTTVRFATGDERFTDLGSGALETPEPGEVIFADEQGLVSARRWCWRQSAESAAGPATREILVTVEGHHATASADVRAALDDLLALLQAHVTPASMVAEVLDAGQPAFQGLDAA
jgi:DNA/RNA-binding domain of Phe-tRNA-synthetase-like protein